MEELERSPKSTHQFIGHEEQIKNLTSLIASGRVPHAFLVTGLKGIGKATFVYRTTRFILSGGLDKPLANNLFGEPEINFDMSPSNSIFSKIAQMSHPDLMVIETEEDEKEIKIEKIRKIGSFVRLTSAESGWRVVIIDGAEDMNRNAANALLKILEEPNAKSIIFLISHSPGSLLPTIRSRTSVIRMKPLPHEKTLEILNGQGFESESSEAKFALQVAEGAPGYAVTLLESDAYQIYNQLLNLISSLPEFNVSGVMEFADKISGKDGADWETANYLMLWLLTRAAKIKSGMDISYIDENEKLALAKFLAVSSLSKISALSEEISRLKHADEIFHIDRKVIVTNIFNRIKQAA